MTNASTSPRLRQSTRPNLARGIAFFSGISALVYQVVWTRQVGLLAGAQMASISVVLVAFFGGLAIGARAFGALCDRSRSALRLYGALEVLAGLSAAFATWCLSRLATLAHLDDALLLGTSALLLLPTTILLGGTMPALLRASTSRPGRPAAGSAGGLIGLNTAGSVLGVAIAVASIPSLGLSRSVWIAATGSILLGGLALALPAPESPRAPRPSSALARPSPAVLIAAFVVGLATLGFEVLATRLATLHLGSSLYAWGLVLALFLAALATGNLSLSRRARTSETPVRDLGWLEILAASSVALGLLILRVDLASPPSHPSPSSLARVTLGVFPAAFFMGGAFPLLARLAFRDESIGDAFGRLGAVNTLGGVAGSLIAPFILLPALGSAAAGLVLAAGNATIGLICLAGRGSGRRLATAGTLLLITAAPLGHRAAPAPDPWVVFVEEGRETTAVVTSSWGNRTLFVDGDPEAASTGHARRTEELLAVLPALLHPSPDRSLEVGLGSGITLGTTARFPLSQIDCVEISPSVVRAASFFVPDNRNVLQSSRVRIENEDARRLLARRVGTYDIISANTLHPWSAGATGLYSHEYFSRMSDALRPNGIAVQWVPTQQIGSTSLSLILRTFFDVFPEGGLWWGAGNVIAVGSMQPLSSFDPRRAEERIQQAGLDWARLGWRNAHEVPSHRIASAAAVRSALGSGNLLFDDRPVLGFYAMRDPSADRAAKLYATLVEIARQEPGKGQMLLWLESLQKRSAGNESTADTLERLASGLGLLIADHALVDRLVAAAHRDLRAARPAEAEEHFEAALAIDPDDRHALFGRAGLAIEAGEIGAAEEALERALSRWPEDVRAWNELAGIYARSGAIDRARATTIKALTANPFDIRSLANAGLIEVSTGNLDGARAMLKRIADLSPLGRSPQEIFLRDALSPSSELR